MNKLIVFACIVALCQGASIGNRKKRPLMSGKIVGGVETDITKVPYQLAFELDGFQFCAATIIGEKIALTAGHCTEGFAAREVQVRAGSSDHESGGTVIQVASIINNDKYDPFSLDYDVAVLILSEPFPLGATAAIAKVTEVEPTAGNVLISGWGDLREGANQGSDTLMSASIPVVDRDLCNDNYSDLGGITDRMFCAGEKGHDTCQGDSGGPVAQNGEIVGITSQGLGCARAGYPGIYTSVANEEIRTFIRDNASV